MLDVVGDQFKHSPEKGIPWLAANHHAVGQITLERDHQAVGRGLDQTVEGPHRVAVGVDVDAPVAQQRAEPEVIGLHGRHGAIVEGAAISFAEVLADHPGRLRAIEQLVLVFGIVAADRLDQGRDVGRGNARVPVLEEPHALTSPRS